MFEVSQRINQLHSKILDKPSQLKLLGLLVTVFTLLIALPRVGIFNRFPGEDLYWNDLQVLNSWRWLSDAIREGGLSQALFGSIDFRQNTGDTFTGSSKWSTQFIDIGAWSFFLVSDLNLAYTFKFFVYALMSAGSLFRLIEQNRSLENHSAMAKLAFFGILISSLVLHPIFFGEVGPLNQMYLLLIPCWFEFLKNARDRILENKSRTLARFLILTFASLAASDLFFIASISAVFFSLYLYRHASKSQVWLLFRIHLIVFAIFILDKSYFIAQLLVSDSQISSQGTWTPLLYWELFLKPALLNSILYPEFVGPSSIFVNSFLIVLIVISSFGRQTRVFRSVILSSLLTFAFLCFAGLVMHSIEDVRLHLPSAIRYHLTFFPFLLLSIVASYGRLPRFRGKNPLKSEFSKTALGLSLTFLIVMSISYLSSSNYGGKVSDYYAVKISNDLGKWYAESLPNCINDIIETSSSSVASRSFLLVKKSETENLMDDSLLIIGEQPHAIKGRTFNQWRYSSGALNHLELVAVGKSGLFNRPFLADDTSEIIRFAQALTIPYVLSTQKLSGDLILQLGRCNFPTKFKSVVEKNNTLGATIFVSQIRQVNTPANSPVLESIFSSSKANFRISCERLGLNQSLKLPINYSSDIVSKSQGIAVPTFAGDKNALRVNLSGVCVDTSVVDLELSSHSKIVGIRNSSYFFSLIALLAGFLIWKNRSRRESKK